MFPDACRTVMTDSSPMREPDRADINAMPGPVLVEFGSSWCGYCRTAQPLIAQALAQHPITHLKIEDGKGRPLGRSFRVTLWPTLVFLKDGQEQARVVRPADVREIRNAMSKLDT